MNLLHYWNIDCSRLLRRCIISIWISLYEKPRGKYERRLRDTNTNRIGLVAPKLVESTMAVLDSSIFFFFDAWNFHRICTNVSQNNSVNQSKKHITRTVEKRLPLKMILNVAFFSRRLNVLWVGANNGAWSATRARASLFSNSLFLKTKARSRKLRFESFGYSLNTDSNSICETWTRRVSDPI